MTCCEGSNFMNRNNLVKWNTNYISYNPRPELEYGDNEH